MSPTKKLAAFILRNAVSYDWSVQGFGMMRLRTSETERFQVWDRTLRVPNVSDIHNHPWDFESHIIAGILYNQRFTPGYRYAGGLDYIGQELKPGEHGEGLIGKPTAQCWVPGEVEIWREDYTYTQKANEMHRSTFEDGTITLIHRVPVTGAADKALVLWESGNWVDARPRPATTKEIKRVASKSLSRWF